MLIDTHCHIHEVNYPIDADEVLARAREEGVEKLICVGTSESSSAEAIAFAQKHENVFAAIGVHPHDTRDGYEKITELAVRYIGKDRNSWLASDAIATPSKQVSLRPENPSTSSLLPDMSSLLPVSELSSLQRKRVTISELAELKQSSARQELPLDFSGHLNNAFSSVAMASEASARQSKLVAIGEIGLDYYYTHSPREVQIAALEAQIHIALGHNLPIIFHVREAFEDFWPIFDNFSGIRGELHSFTDTQANLEEGLKRGLYIGVNGISTFTKDRLQQEMFMHIPLEKMLLETDAPFLTPAPNRGKVNEPAFVRYVAKHHATIRGIAPEEIAQATSTNASTLFAV